MLNVENDYALFGALLRRGETLLRTLLSEGKNEKDYLREYRSRGNPDGMRDNLVCIMLPVVMKMAKTYKSRYPRVEFAELVHSGILGICEGIDKFDMEKGANIKLANFVIFYVKSSLDSIVSHSNPQISVPHHFKIKSLKEIKTRSERKTEESGDTFVSSSSDASGRCEGDKDSEDEMTYREMTREYAENQKDEKYRKTCLTWSNINALSRGASEDDEDDEDCSAIDPEVRMEQIDKRLEAEKILNLMRALDAEKYELVLRAFGFVKGGLKTSEKKQVFAFLGLVKYVFLNERDFYDLSFLDSLDDAADNVYKSLYGEETVPPFHCERRTESDNDDGDSDKMQEESIIDNYAVRRIRKKRRKNKF